MRLRDAVGSESLVPCSLWKLPVLLGLLLVVLMTAGCGQGMVRQVAVDPVRVTEVAPAVQQAEVVAGPSHAEPVVEQPASASQPLLFADDRPEPYQPRGPPGLTFLPMFPAPLILPFDVRMPSEVGIVVDHVVRGQHVVAWAAISPVGWRVGAVRTVGFRYYNPITGRYISRDPIGFASGVMNLYMYVSNNPINKIDPLGLTETPWAAALTIGWDFGNGSGGSLPYVRASGSVGQQKQDGDSTYSVQAYASVYTGGQGTSGSPSIGFDVGVVGTFSHGHGAGTALPMHLTNRDPGLFNMTKQNEFAISQGVGYSSGEGTVSPYGAFAAKFGDVSVEHTNDSFTAWGAARAITEVAAGGQVSIDQIHDSGWSSGLYVNAALGEGTLTLGHQTYQGYQDGGGTTGNPGNWLQTPGSLGLNRTDNIVNYTSPEGTSVTGAWSGPHTAQNGWHDLWGFPKFDAPYRGGNVEVQQRVTSE